jgi:hypothetical protein
MIIDPKRPHGVDTIKMIEGDDRLREQKCLQEIQRVCNQYDCEMVPEVIISRGQIITRVAITAKPRVAPETGRQN